jgi:hypothetical protein
VAEPAKFNVVTLVLTKSKDALDVVIEVLILGLVLNTTSPDPVSSVKDDARLAEDGVAKNVAIFAPSPETPVEIGRLVALAKFAKDGVPIFGVVKTGELNVAVLIVGEFAKTKGPEPVSSVTAVAKLAEVGVAKKVATPVPSPDTPVEIGRPVALDKTA